MEEGLLEGWEWGKHRGTTCQTANPSFSITLA